jgi:hypothetical protein
VGGVGEQRLRHINDSVLSSLKMEGIRFFFILNCKIMSQGGGGGEKFRIQSDRTSGPPSILDNVLRVSFLGVN